jgi:hypothetical protein
MTIGPLFDLVATVKAMKERERERERERRDVDEVRGMKQMARAGGLLLMVQRLLRG